MKIKGIEMRNYGIFVRSAVNIEEYMKKFYITEVNPIEITVVNEESDDIFTYNFFCENRKVAAKVLKRIREDLQDGFLDMEFKNYSDFILKCMGSSVTIIVFDPTSHSKFFKVKTGENLPF